MSIFSKNGHFPQTMFLLVFLAITPFAAFTQTNFTTVKTTSEKALRAFKEGRVAMQQGDIAGGIRYYQKATDTDPQFIDAYLYLGGAFKEGGSLKEAEAAFEKVLALSPSYEMRVYDVLALVEWDLDKYAEAATHLDYYLQSEAGNTGERPGVERRLRNARFAAEAIKNPVPFNPEPLEGDVNTKADEYFPVFTADGQTLIFTRNDYDDENFYQSERLPGEKETWGPAKVLEGVNTTLNEGAEAISPDGSWLVFTACDRTGDGSQGSCDLYWSQKKSEGWTKPTPFSSVINTPSWDSQPTISADGKTIIFSSSRSGSLGNRDLWETTRLAGGKWSTPRNLGDKINTTSSDCFPFLHADGQTLYFTSTGHPGMGGDDIFVVRKQTGGEWGTPQNLGYPINTKGNEGNLVTSLDGTTAYFSAVRPEGPGGVDIYKFEMPVGLRPKTVTYARAQVTDAATGYPVVARVEFTDLVSGLSYVSSTTKKDGTFLVCLPAGHHYALNVSRKGYLFQSEHFELDSSASFLQPYELHIELQPVPDSTVAAPTGQPITLKNVFFNTGSAELLPASTTELNALAALLQENTALKIQINGHTDNAGDDNSNLNLSERRAQAVRNYLIGKGITSDRLRSRGFGETKPIAPNDTPEGRGQNRRTEFEVW